MTGPEHFLAAEGLLHQADAASPSEPTAEMVARAQVHATLAVAAAIALTDPADRLSLDAYGQWLRALGDTPTQ